MNKLYVALKLLRLLNERRSIDSGLVAEELSVRLRTAQRYLNELSGMPCVITSDENNRSYSLSSEYRLNNALFNGGAPVPSSGQSEEDVKEWLHLRGIVCKVCGNECEKRGI
jgi:hypothetical protein